MRKIILIMLAICSLLTITGFTKGEVKLPKYEAIMVSDIKSCEYTYKTKGKIEKYKLSEFEINVIDRLLKTSEYIEPYTANGLSNIIMDYYIDVNLKTGKTFRLYIAGSGAVSLDSKRMYFIHNDSMEDFIYNYLFNYKMVNGTIKQTIDKYKPVNYRVYNLLQDIRKQGLKYTYIRTNSDGILSDYTITIKVNNENISIDEYKDNIDMEINSMKISKDGSSISRKGIFEWVVPPHFYKRGNLIVCLWGEDKNTISVLNKILGNQFAGW